MPAIHRIEAFKQHLGSNLDVLVNAGINRVDPVDGLDDEDWYTVIDVNLTRR